MTRFTFILFLAVAIALVNFQWAKSRVLALPSSLADAAITSSELIVDPEDIRSQPAPPPFTILDTWTDWETWEASPDVIASFPYCKMGHDLDGLPVYLIDFGKWNFREWGHQSPEKLTEFWKYYEQLMRRGLKDAGMNNGAGVVHFIDFDGFSLSHHASPKAIKFAMKVFAGLVRAYPYVSYGFFVNVNFAAETFINVGGPFVRSYLDKSEIYGSRMEKWKPMIFRKISADQLAPKYGGSSSWRPVPLQQ